MKNWEALLYKAINEWSNSRSILALPPKQTLTIGSQQLLNKILSRWLPATKHSHEPPLNCFFLLSWVKHLTSHTVRLKMEVALGIFFFREVIFPPKFEFCVLCGAEFCLPSQTSSDFNTEPFETSFDHRVSTEHLVSFCCTGSRFKQILVAVWLPQAEELAGTQMEQLIFRVLAVLSEIPDEVWHWKN